ncbi:hypothetical protein Vretifemale_12186, partial [Volvox reticuliferus]
PGVGSDGRSHPGRSSGGGAPAAAAAAAAVAPSGPPTAVVPAGPSGGGARKGRTDTAHGPHGTHGGKKDAPEPPHESKAQALFKKYADTQSSNPTKISNVFDLLNMMGED